MENILLILALIMSCGIVLITVPPTVRVARAKHLFDVTNDRKVHITSTPTLGGISIFMAISITTAILTVGHPAAGNQILYASMIMLFFVGIKDDIIYIAPHTKFFIQLLVAFMIVILGDYSITNFEGILGIHKVPPIIGYSFTIAFIVLMINAYNLIDGIDGLAGIMGITVSLFFGAWFYMNGLYSLAILSTAVVGSLLGFLRFNIYGREYKIFMGDTGSLLLGLLMAMQVIWFLQHNLSPTIPYPVNAAASIALAVVAIPLVDTFRVFTLRIVRNQSPFHPDNNHIHHRLLIFLPKHLHCSLSITAGNLFIIFTALLLSFTGLNINIQFFGILVLSSAISMFPGILIGIIKRRKISRPIKPFSELELKVMNYNIKYKGEPVKSLKVEEKEEKK